MELGPGNPILEFYADEGFMQKKQRGFRIQIAGFLRYKGTGIILLMEEILHQLICQETM